METAARKITPFDLTGRTLSIKGTYEANGEKLVLSFLYVDS
jgi:hypothetical protein